MATAVIASKQEEIPQKSTFTGKWSFNISGLNQEAIAKIPPYSIINSVIAECEMRRTGTSLSTSNTSAYCYWANSSGTRAGDYLLEKNNSITTSYKPFSVDITSYFHSGDELAGQANVYGSITLLCWVSDGLALRDHYIQNARVTVNYTPPSYYLDVNGWIDGAETPNLNNVATFEVYINGSYVKTDNDYWAQHPYGSRYEIKSINALPGWHYDDVHSGSLTGTLTQETKVILAFSRIKCRVLASASTGGSVDGDGTYDYGTSVTLTAVPDDGYEFAYWSDNQSDTKPSRTFTVTSDLSLTAVFVKKKYEVTVLSTGGGTVSGAGTYEHGAVVTLTAVPDDGYEFVSWDDGNTDPTRTITVTSNLTYSVIFESTQTVKRPVVTDLETEYNGMVNPQSIPMGAWFTITVSIERQNV